jgi:hypothetical protein
MEKAQRPCRKNQRTKYDAPLCYPHGADLADQEKRVRFFEHQESV